MTTDAYRKEAHHWTAVRSASYYDRFGANLFNFKTADDNLRRWFLNRVAASVVDAPPQDIYFLENQFVSPDLFVFSRDKILFSMSKVDQGQEHAFDEFQFENATTIDRPVALIFKSGFNNYGHLLIEMLPKLELLVEAGVVPVPLLCPALSRNLREFVTFVINTCYPDMFSIIDVNSTGLKIKSLIIPGPVSRHNDQKSDIVWQFADKLSSSLGIQKKLQSSLYISRARVSNRRMINESEVENIFVGHGFEVIYPEALTIPEQIVYFSGAKRIAGPLGAGLSNIVFGAKGSEITMIDHGLYDLFFYDLACLREMSFNWVFTNLLSMDTPIEKLHRDFLVDIELIRSISRYMWT